MGGLFLLATLVALRVAHSQTPCGEEVYVAIVDTVVPTLDPTMLTTTQTRLALRAVRLDAKCANCLAMATEESKNVLALFEACTGTAWPAVRAQLAAAAGRGCSFVARGRWNVWGLLLEWPVP
jgi:hypothetical protein